MNDEVWMPVVGNNDYEVSSLGRVRSLERVVGGRLRHERVLKQCRNGKNGYVGVSIGGKSMKTHRLVCCAFFGHRDSSWHVNHKNGIRDDNRLCNLEWCTAGENVRHSFSVLGKKSRGGHHGKTGAMNHNSKTVVGVNLSTGEVRTFGSTAEAARKLGIGSGSVPRCCNGMYKHSAGWSFRYAE